MSFCGIISGSISSGVGEIVNMPSRTLDLLFRFLKQNNARLSKRALDKEFSQLTEEEVDQIENLYASVFQSN